MPKPAESKRRRARAAMDLKHEPIFEMVDVLRMFPTFVWKAGLKPEAHRRLNQSIIAKLEEVRPAAPELADGRGWQSGQDLHQWDEFSELVGFVNEAVRCVLELLKIAADEFEITGLWANMNTPGSAHKMHDHPNNFLSGVYYVQTAKGADTINFHDPRPQAQVIRPAVTELTAENTDQVVVKVSNGTLLLFPSWLAHSVDANGSGKTRISISFNVMFSAFAENLAKPLW